jgi:hypothetical protein
MCLDRGDVKIVVQEQASMFWLVAHQLSFVLCRVASTAGLALAPLMLLVAVGFVLAWLTSLGKSAST